MSRRRRTSCAASTPRPSALVGRTTAWGRSSAARPPCSVRPVRIAILIFDRFPAPDAIGPSQVLSRLPGAELRMVGTETGPKRTDTGALGIEADLALAELTDPDVVLVPGGAGSRPLMGDP